MSMDIKSIKGFDQESVHCWMMRAHASLPEKYDQLSDKTGGHEPVFSDLYRVCHGVPSLRLVSVQVRIKGDIFRTM